MKINAVFDKELKINSRSTRTLVTILIINSLLAIIGLIVYWAMMISAEYTGMIDYSEMILFYQVIAYVLMGIFLLEIPAITASAISSEREKQTLEMLVTTKMKPMQIIWGKMYAALITLGLYIVMTFPIVALIFTIGGVGLFDILWLLVAMLVIGFFVGSIGIFMSSVIRRTIGSIVLTYLSVITFCLGTILIVGLVVFIAEIRNSNTVNSYVIDAGPVMYVLLLNPVMTFVDVITKQVGQPNYIVEICSDICSMSDGFIFKHWGIASMIVQTGVGYIFLRLAAKNLNPVRKVKMKK